MLHTGTKQIIEVPHEIVDNGARTAICDIVAQEANEAVLPFHDEFWQWINEEGKLPKRIAKYVKRQKQIKLSDETVGKIGSIGGLSITEDSEYTYDFTRNFDWYDGDFGDGGSCYWGSNEGARQMLRDNGAYAIRFYDERGRGFARAWLYEIEPDLWVVWNGYGLDTVLVARIFSHILGGSYRTVSLSNDGSKGGLLYINDAHQYIVSSDPAKLEACPSYLDLNWEDAWQEHCDDCGTGLSEDNCYYPNDSTIAYCESCYNDRFAECANCGEEVDKDYAEEVYDPNARYAWERYTYYCQHCFGELFARCVDCGEPYRLEALKVTADDRYYCDDCLKNDDTLGVCDDCGMVRDRADLQEKGLGFLCIDRYTCARADAPDGRQLALALNEGALA